MNWGTFIFLILAFGLPALGKAANKISEQRKLKEIQAERGRRHNEMLRTGRAAPEPPIAPIQPKPDRSLEALAERRKAQLAQLRQQQQQRAQQLRQRIQQRAGQPPTAGTVAPRAPVPPAAPTLPIPGGLVDLAAQRQRPGTLTPSQRANAQRRLAQLKTQPKTPPIAKPHQSLRERMAQAESIPTPPSRPAETAGLVPKTPADWRRAIIAKELLSAPVALRDSVDPADLIG